MVNKGEENQQLDGQVSGEEAREEISKQAEEEALEELEPEEEDSSNDFFSQDPVELDEALEQDNDDGEREMGERSEADQEGPGQSREKAEEIKEDSEAVALDEPEEAGEGASQQEKEGEKGKAPETPKPEPGAEADRSEGRQRESFFKRNKALIGVMIFGMSFVAAGFFLGSKMGKKKAKPLEEQKIIRVSDPIVQRKLDSFFVLLQDKKENELMAKIDFVVNWTKICGIRYAESRHEIRAAVYGFLKNLLGKGVNPQKDKALIEEGAAQVLNHALGVTAVKVSSMEVEFI